MKKIYGDHMEDFHKSKTSNNEWSEKDKEEFRQMVTQKIKQSNMMEGLFNTIIFIAIAAIVGMAIYFGFRL